MSRRSNRPRDGAPRLGTAPSGTAQRNPSRRRVLRLTGGLALLTPVLAACASGTSTSANGANAGYVSGDGVVVEIPPGGRAAPLEIRGTTYDGNDFDSTALRG